MLLKRTFWVLLPLSLVVVLLGMLRATVEAQIPQPPHRVFGTITIDGNSQTGERELVVSTGGRPVLTTTLTFTNSQPTDYLISIPADDPTTPSTFEGGVNGETVSFTLNGAVFTHTFPFESGTVDERNFVVEQAFVMLEIGQTVAPISAKPTTPVTYTVVVTNSGNITATGGVLSTTLPSGLTFVNSSVDTPNGTAGSAPELVTGLEIAPASTLTVIYQATIDNGLAGGTQLTNTVGVTSTEYLTVVTDIAVVTVLNVAPVSADDTATTDEEVPVTIDVLANDSDINGDTLSVGGVGSADNGTLTTDGAQLTYTPTLDFNGTEIVTYIVSDGSLTAVGVVTITVNAVNDAPVAVDDNATTNEDETVTIDVIANDTDIEGDALSIATLSTAANGAATIDGSAEIIYTPTLNFNGTETLSYTVSDGDLTDSGSITITVNAVNDAPVAIDDSATTNEDETVTLNVIANDTDIEGDGLSISALSSAANGTAVISGTTNIVYTPIANFNGTEILSYTVSDGDLTDSGSITITVDAVNDAPVAVDDNATTNEDETVTIDVIANDTDIEGDALSIATLSTAANGAATIDGSAEIIYTPTLNFNGTETLSYTVSDGDLTDSGSITITVNAVNDAPVAIDDSATTNEDETVTLNVIANDTDIEGDGLSISALSSAANGTAVISGTTNIVYTPIANFNGTEILSYTVSDGDLTDSGSITITVNAINDAPIAVTDSYTTAEDTTLTAPVATGVLANDTDIEDDPLTAIEVTAPTNGILTLNTDGSFEYVPNANFNGSDSFAYKANDGTADSNTITVSLTIDGVNDVPVVNADSYTTLEDTPLVIPSPGVLGNDDDADGDTLTSTLVEAPDEGELIFNTDGSFVYTPTIDFNGLVTFTYLANDGQADSNIDTVTISVSTSNDAPNAIDDAYAGVEDTPLVIDSITGVLSNDSDIDGDTLLAVLESAPLTGTLSLNPDGSFAYTPPTDFAGQVSFTYHANDGTLDSNSATVTLTISTVNDAPIAVTESYTTIEDTTLTVSVAQGVLANDTDIEDDPLTAIEVTAPTNGILTLNTDGSFEYVPNANFNGSDSFAYKANDGTADSNTITVSLTIDGVNDVPVVNADSYTTLEDTPLVIPSPGVLGNDDDADGDTLTSTLVEAPDEGELIFNTDGSFVYTPTIDFNGLVTFTYLANDGQADSNIDTVTISVSTSNDAPNAIDDAYAGVEDTPLVIDSITGVLSNDSDIDGDTLLAVLESAPLTGTLSLNPDGSFAYTPPTDFAGQVSFTYHANDGTLDSNSATVTLTISTVNDAPIAVTDSYTTAENLPLTIPVAIGVLSNDTDVENDTLIAIEVTAPTNGSLALNMDGSFEYVPNTHFNGSDSFAYKANDGHLDSNTITVNLNITSINSVPIAVSESYTTTEDTMLNVSRASGVLANDTDTENDLLTAVEVTAPLNGTLMLNADGSFDYVPNADFNGSDSFAYKANDGISDSNTVTVDLTIEPINDAPFVVADVYTTTEDAPLTVSSVLDNDSDAENDALTATLVNDVLTGMLQFAADGTFSYTPGFNFDGVDQFTYIANDGLLDSDVVIVTLFVAPDPDGDLIRNALDVDDDNDGILDTLEPDGDTDRDGVPDREDIDSDNDGLPDIVEAQTTLGYVAPLGNDANGNGWDAQWDSAEGGTPPPVLDFDADLLPDYLDPDSDNDHLPDLFENGIADTLLRADSDGDGLDDIFEGFNLLDDNRPQDSFLAPWVEIPDFDGDVGAGGDVDYRDVDPLPVDSDGDGVPNSADLDDDNDGVSDIDEGLGLGRQSSSDMDTDGRPNHADLDSDNNGIPDTLEIGVPDANFDGIHDGWDEPNPDANGNGMLDSLETTPAVPANRDQDNMPDYLDRDDLNYGVMDTALLGFPDEDGDGIHDGWLLRDPDTNGNGWLDSLEGMVLPALLDPDHDGVVSSRDQDFDADGVPSTLEIGFPDENGDGIHDGWDEPNPDTNRNGVLDLLESELNGTPFFANDSDGDGRPDFRDLDDDNDGIVSNIEAQAIDSYVPPSGEDADGDGLDDAYDPDFSRGVPLPYAGGDTDGDGRFNYTDQDANNDYVPDSYTNGIANEPLGIDTDGDGLDDAFELGGADDGFIPNNGITDPASVLPDADGNGVPDVLDNTTPPADVDGDHIPDVIEVVGDRDGDGVLNIDDFEPTGYFYEETTGRILLGGSITVTGGNVTLHHDGSDGYYLFTTDQKTAIYTITVTPPEGFALSNSCAPQAAFAPPRTRLYQLGATQLGDSDTISDTTCVANPYYLTLNIKPDIPILLSNNIPLRSITDYGDLPANYGATLFSEDGARHIIGDLFLGELVDAEVDGRISADSQADPSDDGVMLASADPWYRGAERSLRINITGGAGRLVGWFDWNRDGTFDESAEMIDFGTLQAGIQLVSLTVPEAFDPLQDEPLVVRFRLFDTSITRPTLAGIVENGEVEDYVWEVPPPRLYLPLILGTNP